MTGGTGFIGSALVRQLVNNGYPVRVLVREHSKNLANLEGLDVELVNGDLTDRASVRRALENVTAVFHFGADYRLWVRDPAQMERVNVAASRQIVEDAAEAGVKRLVYCSSVATLGHAAPDALTDESTPSDISQMVGHYKRTKFLGETAAVEAASRTGLDMVTVNPSAPVGPRDRRPTPTGQMVLDALNGNMPAYVDTGLNIVHVDDVATGTILAYEKGKAGERYILGGDNLALHDILAQLARITGCKIPQYRLNAQMLMPVAWLAERMAAFTGQEPRIHLDVLRMARRRMYFSSAKAERELGYTHRPAADALTDAAHWFQQQGKCKNA